MTISTVRVAGVRLLADSCRTGILFAGSSGSGKTSLLKKLMVDVLKLGDPLAAIDLADELTEFITAKAPAGTPVYRIDVHHMDGCGIDFAAVLTSETMRQQFVAKICPEVRNDPQPFFRTRARWVIQWVLRVLDHIARGKWRFADMVRIASSRDLISSLAKSLPDCGGDPYGDLGMGDSARDIAGTVTSVLQPLSIYAALAERAPRSVSPTALIDSPRGAMVLVWKDRYQVAMEAVFAFVLDAIAEAKLSQQNNQRLWIFGDEIRTLRPLDSLPNIARRGRKSSVCMVLTMHEISGIRDRYGKERAEEMLALLDHKVFLRLGSPETGKWASDYLGAVESLESVPPVDPTGRDTSIKRSVKERQNVRWDELRRIKLPDAARDRIEGYIDFPNVTSPFGCPFLADVQGVTPVSRTPVPVEWEILRRMTEEDLVRLNLPNTKAIREALGS